MPVALPNSIAIALWWQVAVTGVLCLAAGLAWGVDAAVSAFLGGLVNIVAGGGFGWMASRSAATSPERVVLGALRAEAVKVVLTVIQIGLVLAFYSQVDTLSFLLAFIATVLASTIAVAVRD